MDAWVQTAMVALAALAVWLLWARGPQGAQPGKLRLHRPNGTAPAALAGPPRAPRPHPSVDVGPDDDEVGGHAHCAAQIALLRSEFKLLRNEWQDKESRVDSLLKRINRLRKLEGDIEPPEQPQPVLSAAEQRAAIVRRAREAGGI